ncbi:MAG: ribonuclease P [Candidatus Thermoplasmatota archaeon]|nr:ribonuclease P [Candidatus Thermoplasmatota archaeon]
MVKRINKKQQKHIAEHRIKRLFAFAKQQINQGKEPYAQNAVRIARKIAMKTATSLPKEYKHIICKHCYQYLYPGINCRIRFHNKRKIVTCHKCQNSNRYPYKPKRPCRYP